MQWGQFLDHDMDLSPFNPSDVGFKSGIPCEHHCENEMPCFPIPIPANDPRMTDAECMGFSRSSALCGSGHSSVAREQLNELTSFFDASQVYGSTDQVLNMLRDKNDPKFLRRGMEIAPGKYLLPLDEDREFSFCDQDRTRNDTCFLAGDKRSSEMIGLSVMHTLWFREHNRIASRLAEINPHWDDETIFQEARKIVIAQVQQITYKEWLPKIIGITGMKKLGPYKGYDPTVNAGILNSFATAIFRFGHTLINPQVMRLDKNFTEIPQGHLALHQAFFAPFRIIEEGGIDPSLRGLFFDGAKKPDPKNILNKEVTERLFELAFDIAMDLAALNIQRSRDHGLASYVQIREFCGLKKATSFNDLRGEISKRKVLKTLKELYGDARKLKVNKKLYVESDRMQKPW